MIRLIRSELRKYTSTRLMWGMAAALFVVGAAFAVLFASVAIWARFADSPEMGVAAGRTLAEMLPDDVLARFVYLSQVSIGYLLTLCIGVIVIGQEFRHKTATSTFLAEPRRGRVIAAKCAALALISTVNGLLFLAGSVIGGGVLLGIQGYEIFPDPANLVRAFALALLVLVLWAWIGLGVGVLISNQIVALLVAIAVVWIVEPLATVALSFVSWGDDLTRFFPASVSNAAVDATSGIPAETAEIMGFASGAFTWWVGALLLALYAAVMALVGVWLTRRRDIS